MKDIKIALKAIVTSKRMGKSVWREGLSTTYKDYLALALVSAVCAYSFLVIACDTLLPIWVYGRSTGEWGHVMKLVGISPVWATAFVATLVLTIVCSARAHRAMKRFVGRYDSRELAGNRKNLLIVECTFCAFAAIWVGMVPPLVIFFSALASARESMLQEPVATPTWVVVVFTVSICAAMLLVEVTLTFVRLAFRNISKDTSAEENKNNNHDTEDNIDGLIASDSNDSFGLSAPQKDSNQDAR